MSYQDFINDHQNKRLGSAVVLYGAEDFLINWAIDRIIEDNVEKEYKDIDVRILEGDNIGAYDILSEARAYSMFSPKRVVVVKDYLPMISKSADAGMNELADYAQQISKEDDINPSILIFAIDSNASANISSYAKNLIKKCNSYEFTRLERSELTAFVNKRIRAAGKILTNKAMVHLIDVTGYYNKDSNYSLSNLDSDLVKLVAASDDDDISAALIDEIMTGDSDKFVFDLVDAISGGDKGRALEIAKSIIREEDASMAVLSLLTKQFEIMYDSVELSKKGMSMTEMAKLTGVHEYRFKKAYKAAVKYNEKRLKNLLAWLYDTDRKIKSGDIDKDAALELFAVRAAV